MADPKEKQDLLTSAGLALLLLAAGFSAAETTDTGLRIGPGDGKQGYENRDYTTRSLSIERRLGTAVDLLSIATERQSGLPDQKRFQAFEPDAKKIALGRQLFFDRRLSRNKTMSCAMCHIPEQGFSNNELKRPIGFEGRAVKRNAPTVLNVVFKKRLFVDARENSLAQQAWSPLLAENEMNNPSIGWVIDQLTKDADYNARFMDAFSEPATMINVGQALAQYQQALVAGNSRFDRWFFQNDQQAMSKVEIRGFEVFRGKAGCVRCHTVGSDHALFTDEKLHNTGVGYKASMLEEPETLRVQLAPGISAEVDHRIIQQVREEKLNDLGRYEVTQDPEDRWQYLTPSLRNVAMTAPYMHNGEFLTLRSVVEFYNAGGMPHGQLSLIINPLDLTESEISAVVAFLKTLNGGNIAVLVSDAFAVSVGDTR